MSNIMAVLAGLHFGSGVLKNTGLRKVCELQGESGAQFPSLPYNGNIF
jgi:hypothetical protein